MVKRPSPAVCFILSVATPKNSEETHSTYKLCQEPCKSCVRGYSQKCLAGNVHLQLIGEGTRICCY